MKPTVLALALGLAAIMAAPVPALAQAAHDHHGGHDHHGAGATAATAALSIDSPVEALVADAKAKAVLDANLPGLTEHPHYAHFKGMSLKQLAGMAPDQITPAVLDKVAQGLAAPR